MSYIGYMRVGLYSGGEEMDKALASLVKFLVFMCE